MSASTGVCNLTCPPCCLPCSAQVIRCFSWKMKVRQLMWFVRLQCWKAVRRMLHSHHVETKGRDEKDSRGRDLRSLYTFRLWRYVLTHAHTAKGVKHTDVTKVTLTTVSYNIVMLRSHSKVPCGCPLMKQVASTYNCHTALRRCVFIVMHVLYNYVCVSIYTMCIGEHAKAPGAGQVLSAMVPRDT